MRGKKNRQSKLFYNFSLEEIVPADDFYRKLEKAVDLSWVRPKVDDRYSNIGRPSIDPEVIVKIELIGYLEGITSERNLMRQINDRLSLRRYIGYDIDEQVPDHSTLSKARDLLGKELFQAIFDHSVRLCQNAGMVGGIHLSGDRTIVKANASLDSLEPRIVHQSPQEFVEHLFTENPVQSDEYKEPGETISLCEQPNYPTRLPIAVELNPTLEPTEGEADHKVTDQEGKAPPSNASHISRTDPDATLLSRPGKTPMLAYSAEFWTDSRAGVITHADAVTGTVPEHHTVVGALRQQRQGFGLAISSTSLDKGYGQGRLYRQLKQEHVIGFVPHKENVNSTSGPGMYGRQDFTYDQERGCYVCPAGKELKYSCLRVRWPWVKHAWQAKPSDCKVCHLRCNCTRSRYRTLEVNIYQSYYDEMDQRLKGPGARLAAIARRTGPEPRFGQAKQYQGLERAKYRGLEKFQGQVLLTAAAQNLKKYVKWTWRKGRGAAQAKVNEMTERLSIICPTYNLSLCSLFDC